MGLQDTVDGTGLVRTRFSGALQNAYRIETLRGTVVRLAHRLEEGRFRSATLRDILVDYHGVGVGAYSYGSCLRPGAFPPGVSVGRYVSVAKDVGVYRRRRPLDRLSLHPYFLNSDLRVASADAVISARLRIEHDAWIGDRSIVLPGCVRIGIGAVVGAGAVVGHDVPDFAVVAGNPAEIIRFRFTQDVQAAILSSRWWESGIDELHAQVERFEIPVEALPGFVRDLPAGSVDLGLN